MLLNQRSIVKVRKEGAFYGGSESRVEFRGNKFHSVIDFGKKECLYILVLAKIGLFCVFCHHLSTTLLSETELSTKILASVASCRTSLARNCSPVTLGLIWYYVFARARMLRGARLRMKRDFVECSIRIPCSRYIASTCNACTYSYIITHGNKGYHFTTLKCP